jgi:23S rRNA (guanine745-N1)-methyltransferase
VKGCGTPLAWGERACACPRGHSFDRARSGYVNLLGPQDKRAAAPGDSKEAVRARSRLLDRGLGAHVLETIAALLSRRGSDRGATALEVGCGDGHFLRSLAARLGLDAYGVDLSSAAVDAAARRAPELRWIAANADRRLPFADGAFDVALSITSRKNGAELARLLRPGGLAIVTVPGPGDLAELRAAVQGRAAERDRATRAAELLGDGFALEERVEARATARLDRESIADLLLSTYRGARRSAADRIAALDALDVTLCSDVLCFRRT